MNENVIKKGKIEVVVKSQCITVGCVTGIFLKIICGENVVFIWGNRYYYLRLQIGKIVRDNFPHHNVTWKQVYDFSREILNQYKWD